MNSLRIIRDALRAVVFILTSISAVKAGADVHDDVVYQRYSRKVMAGKIPYDFDMKFTELTRPGTQQDIDEGKAVFTFAGLGPCRVWKLPQCPIFCDWPALKDYPWEGQSNNGKTNYDNSGYICQAEELQINGEWKRYFGFVCKHGIAVVPAQEVYLWFKDCCCDTRTNWTQLPGGIDWGILDPGEQLRNGIVISNALNSGDPLPVEVFLRNRRGVAQSSLGPMYRGAQNGGPAFRQGIRLSLEWAPFDRNIIGRRYPDRADFKAVSPICTNRFSMGERGVVLATEQVEDQGTFDLRNWFKIDSPGYYRYQFKFDPAVLGLPVGENDNAEISGSFMIGSEPKRVTVEELNRDIPVFGGSAEVERVRALIKRDISAASRSPNPKTLQQLPTLEHTPIPSPNGPPDEPDVVGLWIANEGVLQMLKTNASGRQKLEILLDREAALPMKLLLASEAAPLGSQKAALFLFDCMTNTDYTTAENTYTAIRFAFNHYKDRPPDWLVETAIAALSDERYATGLERRGWSSDTVFKLSYLADEHGDLTAVLGYMHCTNAVPFLIEMTKKTDGRRGPVMALGTMGDARAIPILVDLVERKGPTAKLGKYYDLDDDFFRPVVALGDLQAKEAVPVLLQYIAAPDVIEALEQIGDTRIIGPLQKLIAANGRIESAGVTNDPEWERQRLVAALIAVASLAPTNRTAELCKLFSDSSFEQFDRRTIIWRLGDQPDPQAIPFLAKAIKSDPSGAVVNQAITVLAAFKYKAAVDALIESFDADFNGKRDWKRAYTPEMFRDNIADSLSHLTGQKIGADKQRWVDWWKEHREMAVGLK